MITLTLKTAFTFVFAAALITVSVVESVDVGVEFGRALE